MVLLSTHNIHFGWEIRKLNFRYALLTKVLIKKHYTIIDFNKVDMRIYLPKKRYSPRPQGWGEYYLLGR